MTKYVEFHARSAFSFLEGGSVPEEMAERCAQLGIPAMALLDANGVYGAPRFHMAMKKLGLKAHIGAEIPFPVSRSPFPAEHARTTERETGNGKRETRLPLLASSQLGYQNLCRLITRMKLRPVGLAGVRDPKHAETWATEDDLRQFSSGLICLTGGDNGPLSHALAHGGSDEARRTVERLVDIFGSENIYVELQRHFTREEEARNQAAIAIARALKLPLVATNAPQYAHPEQRQILDVLTCIREHTTLDSAGRRLQRNSERHVKSAAQMQQLFAGLPEAIAATEELSARLEFTLADLGYQFPRYPVPEGETMMSFLRKRTTEGFDGRYGRAALDLRLRARRQIERELALIEKLDLAGYFLIVWDIIRFCREHNILVQGRGSAANSAVCYALGITAVDPVGMDLLFERFLSEERGEWPDIDLDLPSGDQRERAIQYVYERYGKLPPQHANTGRAGDPGFGAAMTANVITYRGRSAAREIGKALGFDNDTLNRLSAMVGSWEYKDPSDTLERQFRDAGMDLRHPRMRKFFELCLAVQDLPRHLGQHSGGMVICQGQLDSVVPLEPASMPGRVVVQWDKEDCADLGIIKVDLLGLGMMAVLEDSLRLIRDHYGEEVDLAHLPPDDPVVYSALQQADTVGMFQIESRAQMSCLPRLRPQRFYDIVVQVAIIRPGPIVGKMVNPFLLRRMGREPVTYPHPSLEPVLARTLGVPLFQEQLLRMAMITAGFSGGEAEELRRAMGFKRSEKRMKDIEVKLRAGMTRNGIAPDAQQQIIDSIVSFALYGFPESHSASFALLAYASAYLKTHYLAAFTAALLNNQPMGFYSPATIVKDAQRHGLKVLPIDVTRSEWPCTLEPVPRFPFPVPREDVADAQQRTEADDAVQTGNGKQGTWNVRLGLRYARGLREEAAHALVEARRRRPFSSIDDLALRVPELRRNELVLLAEIGALNEIGNPPQRHRGTEDPNHGFTRIYTDQSKSKIENRKSKVLSVSPRLGGGIRLHRRDALWQVARASRRSGPLLEGLVEQDAPSPLARMSDDERLLADFRGTGLTVGPHPMAYRRSEMDRMGVCRASDLPRLPSGRRVRTAGAVIARQRPGTAHGFLFLSLEDETGIANAIIPPGLFDRHRLMLVSEQFLLIEGILQNQDNVISVRAERVLPLHITAAAESHDFH
ncbi:MAG: DNA polymerase III subunit alpha [Terriglobales bacterium]